MFNDVLTSVDDDFKNFKPVRFIQQKVGVKPSFIVLPLIIIMLILSLFPSIAPYLITVFTMIYPSYMTFEAINSQNDEKCKKWLTFWLLFGFMTVFDGLLRIILFFMPAYYAFKFTFLLWLYYPRTDGITLLYEKVVSKYIPQLKQTLKNMANKK